MITIIFTSKGGFFAKLLVGSFLAFFLAPNVHAQTYDPFPTPYCAIGFEGSPSYTALENEVTSTDPEGKFLAQFVLEAFAQANANNGLLDSASQTAAVTALNRLQSMWVPASQNFKWSYGD